MYALDGLFGLPCKKSAEESFCPPLHGSFSFVTSDIDEFVDNGSCGQKELFKVSL